MKAEISAVRKSGSGVPNKIPFEKVNVRKLEKQLFWWFYTNRLLPIVKFSIFDTINLNLQL